MMFYILSLKWTTGDYCIWWGPNRIGYTSSLEDAGKYTASQIKDRPSYYNDGKDTIAVPCDVAEMRTRRVVLADVGSIVTASQEHSASGLLK